MMRGRLDNLRDRGLNHHDQLYFDANRRQMRQEEYEAWKAQEHTFHPSAHRVVEELAAGGDGLKALVGYFRAAVNTASCGLQASAVRSGTRGGSRADGGNSASGTGGPFPRIGDACPSRLLAMDPSLLIGGTRGADDGASEASAVSGDRVGISSGSAREARRLFALIEWRAAVIRLW